MVAPVDLAAEGRVAIAASAVAADAPQMLRHAAETVMRTVAVGAGMDLRGRRASLRLGRSGGIPAPRPEAPR